jgi:hypothetical protein
MILLIIYLVFGIAAIGLLIYDTIDEYKIIGVTVADVFMLLLLLLLGPISFSVLVIEMGVITDLGKLIEKIMEFKIIKPSKNK